MKFKKYLKKLEEANTNPMEMEKEKFLEFLQSFVSESTLNKIIKSLKEEIPGISKKAIPDEIWPFVINTMDKEEILEMFKRFMTNKELRKLKKVINHE